MTTLTMMLMNSAFKTIIDAMEKLSPKLNKDGDAIKRTAMDYAEAILTKSPLPIVAYAGRIWIYYGGAYYAIDSKAKTENLIKECIMKLEGIRFVDSKFIEKVLKQIFLEYAEITPNVDADVTYINMKSKVLALYKDGHTELLNHDEKYNFTYKLSYDFDKNATCPVFDKFMETSLSDPELIDVIGEYLGYIFNPNAKNHEKALFLYGDGSNGKSTFNNIAIALFGRENISFVELTEMGDMQKCALMDTKLLNISSDANKKGLNTGAFKKIVSGEPVLGKYLFKDIYTIVNLPKLIVAMNKLPFHNGDNTHGFFRRLLLIPFTNVIKEEDKDYDLERKVIEKELPGILNFAIAGMKRLDAQGKFTEAKAMTEAMNNYKESSNHVATFLEEEQYEAVSPETKTGTSLQQLYAHFKTWCNSYGHNPYSSTYLSNELNHLGYLSYKNSSKHYRIIATKLKKSTGFKSANNVDESNPYETEEK